MILNFLNRSDFNIDKAGCFLRTARNRTVLFFTEFSGCKADKAEQKPAGEVSAGFCMRGYDKKASVLLQLYYTVRNIRCQHKTKHFRYIKQYSFCK